MYDPVSGRGKSARRPGIVNVGNRPESGWAHAAALPSRAWLRAAAKLQVVRDTACTVELKHIIHHSGAPA